MRETALVRKLERVRDVELILDQVPGEGGRGFTMTANRQRRFGIEVPHVLGGLEDLFAAAERAHVDLVEDAESERRNARFLVILELIVAPDQHEIRFERTERFAQDLVAGEQAAAVFFGRS